MISCSLPEIPLIFPVLERAPGVLEQGLDQLVVDPDLSFGNRLKCFLQEGHFRAGGE